MTSPSAIQIAPGTRAGAVTEGVLCGSKDIKAKRDKRRTHKNGVRRSQLTA